MALRQFLRMASAALGFPPVPPDSAAHMLNLPFSRASRPEGHLSGDLPPLWPGQAPTPDSRLPRKGLPLMPLAPSLPDDKQAGCCGADRRPVLIEQAQWSWPSPGGNPPPPQTWM